MVRLPKPATSVFPDKRRSLRDLWSRFVVQISNPKTIANLKGGGWGVAASRKPVRSSVKPRDFEWATRKVIRKGPSFDP
jgi:hypothetical protein